MEILVASLAMLSNIFQLLLIINGKVTTPRISWLIWFVVITMCFVVNLLFNGWDTATILLGTYSIGNALIAGYIINTNPRGWTKKETRLLILVVIVMVIWVSFKIYESSNTFLWATVISLIFLRGAHFVGVWENWKKIIKDPFTESKMVWGLRLLSSGIGCIHIINTKNSYNSLSNMLVSLAQQGYLALTVLTTLILISFQRRKLNQK